MQTVGRYSYRVKSGGHLLPNRAGLDPLTAPSAFNAALKVDLEQLFIPSAQSGAPEWVHSPHAPLLQAPPMAISGGLLIIFIMGFASWDHNTREKEVLLLCRRAALKLV